MTAPALDQRLWNYCNMLPDDGLSYRDYVEQLTFLLFLKMADEQSRAPFNKPSPITKGFGWDKLVKLDGDNLEINYRHTLEELGRRTGMLGTIFRKAQNKVQDPSKLRRLVVHLIEQGNVDNARRRCEGRRLRGSVGKERRRRERWRRPIFYSQAPHLRHGRSHGAEAWPDDLRSCLVPAASSSPRTTTSRNCPVSTAPRKKPSRAAPSTASSSSTASHACAQ
jgi:hypothetical protein